jgi:hypothetical protein
MTSRENQKELFDDCITIARRIASSQDLPKRISEVLRVLELFGKERNSTDLGELM